MAILRNAFKKNPKHSIRNTRSISKRKISGSASHSTVKKGKPSLSESQKTILILIVATLLIFSAHSTKYFARPPFDAEFMKEYPVHGVDVSAYQGDINWNTLYKQGVSFAFIKATEGSSYTDGNFQNNWNHIYRTPIKRGAYHFTSFETPGKSQAQNFISQVPKDSEMLPPVIDIEYYGEFNENPPTKSKVISILIPLIETLESHYGTEPIIYTNKHFYTTYLKKTFKNPVWISDLDGNKLLPDNNEWDFLQYTFEGKLDGYEGSEQYIDLNVFNGTLEELFEY